MASEKPDTSIVLISHLRRKWARLCMLGPLPWLSWLLAIARGRDATACKINRDSIENDDEQFSGYIGSCVDVTEMRQAHTHLQARNDLFDKLTQHFPGVVYQFRLYSDGRSSFPYASDGIRQIYEVTPEEIYEDASIVFSRFHPDDYNLIVDSIQESARTMQQWQLDYRVQLPQKGIRWLSSQSRPEKLDDGSILWHGFITDITERRDVEDALSQSESMMSVILENVSAHIYLKDIEGRYLFANQQLLDLWETTEAEVIGFSDDKFFDAETVAQIRNNDRVVLVDGGSIRNEETNLVPKTGKTATYWSIKIPLYRLDGSIYALCGISTDITERKQLELNLLAAQDDLESTLNAIPDML